MTPLGFIFPKRLSSSMEVPALYYHSRQLGLCSVHITLNSRRAEPQVLVRKSTNRSVLCSHVIFYPYRSSKYSLNIRTMLKS